MLAAEPPDVTYTGGQIGALDGSIRFGVTGSDFHFNGLFVYPSSPHPSITLPCP
jgi:hypothetical protein